MTVNPYLPQSAKIISVKPQTAVDYTFIMESEIKPTSGQFVEVSLPKVGECPISVSDFGEGWFEMTIRRVGKVTNVLHQLKVGDVIFVRGPYGNGFLMDKYRGKEVVVAAGGTGLAPVKSMLNRSREYGGLTLLAGFKSPADVLFPDQLKMWEQDFNVILTVDRGDDNWHGNVGLITQYVKSLQLAKPDEVEVIVVGPPLMMKFTVQEFLGLGVPEKTLPYPLREKCAAALENAATVK